MRLHITNRRPIIFMFILGALVVSIGLLGWQTLVSIKTTHGLGQKVALLQQDVDQLEWGQAEGDSSVSTDSNSYLGSGLAVIEGYFTPIKRSAWGETKKCDGFTVTGGSPDFIKTMIKMVDDGNTIHSKNSFGQPVVNLSIPSALRQLILSSGDHKQIEMVVSNYQDGPGGGVPACYPDVGVLLVK